MFRLLSRRLSEASRDQAALAAWISARVRLMMTTIFPDPMLPQLYQVQRVKREIPDTFTLELEPANGGAIPPFATGQFNMLYVYGVGEIPISISGDPLGPGPLIHTTRAVGTVSRAMQNLKPADMIGVRGPFGSHWPVELAEGKDVVIVAGVSAW